MKPWIEKFVTRKFVAATLTSVLMFIAWLVSEWLPGARENLPSLLTGLVAALSAYTAGNVVQDHVFSRNKVSDKVDLVAKAKQADDSDDHK